jgi:hypothetical protein
MRVGTVVAALMVIVSNSSVLAGDAAPPARSVSPESWKSILPAVLGTARRTAILISWRQAKSF